MTQYWLCILDWENWKILQKKNMGPFGDFRGILIMIFLLLIFSARGSTEFTITIDPYNQYDPAIYDDIVIWVDERNGNSDIYGYNLSTREEFPITTNPFEQYFPAIYEKIIVWTDTRHGNEDIYGYDLFTGKEFQITTDLDDQDVPAIYEDIIVWWDLRSDRWDIYGYTEQGPGGAGWSPDPSAPFGLW